jgi:hypothetical protein
LIAAASAAVLFGARTLPRYSARLLRSDARQVRTVIFSIGGFIDTLIEESSYQIAKAIKRKNPPGVNLTGLSHRRIQDQYILVSFRSAS